MTMIGNAAGLDRIDGRVENILYRSSRDEYAIAEIKDTKQRVIKIVGALPENALGQWVTVIGKWEKHLKYGLQFTCQSCALNAMAGKHHQKAKGKRVEEVEPDEEEASAGAPVVASEPQPEEEVQVDGETLMALAGLNLTETTIKALYKTYKGKTLSIVRTEPFRIAKDIKGFGFKRADMIAKSVGVGHEDPERISAGILYTLRESQNHGNIFMYEPYLIQEAARMLEVDSMLVSKRLETLSLEGEVTRETTQNGGARVYLPHTFRVETDIATDICRIYSSKSYSSYHPKEIERAERKMGIKLDPGQLEAVEQALENSLTVITGGPGTGKSTIIKALVEVFTSNEQEVRLAAPTGRAAKRMSELSGFKASTIHRLLGVEPTPYGYGFKYDNEEPLEADVVIIDEVSMVDEFLMYRLLEAIRSGTKLILIGDADQLPSVGPGQVLSEIIESKCVPVVRLNRIFRQAQGSLISQNARMINEGKVPTLNQGSEFVFYPKESDEETQDFVVKYMKGLKNFDKVNEVQVLSPFKKNLGGTLNLNLHLQDTLNPPSETKREVHVGKTLYREGDKVIQMVNDYERDWVLDTKSRHTEGKGVFNGDVGIIDNIDPDGEEIEILFSDGKRSKYSFSESSKFSHAFAMTIHKSQGSEYPCVVIPLVKGSSTFLNRRLLYTAITRGKRKVVLIGNIMTFYKMISNADKCDRRTGLSEKIQMCFEESGLGGYSIGRVV